MEDRVVHRAMRDCLEPLLEAHAFADSVHGYRPGRNRVTAVRHAYHLLSDGLTEVADIDVAKASTGGTVEETVSSLARWVSDGVFLHRVRHVLEGLPEPLMPGSGLSPLLLNVRLCSVDDALSDLNFVRFADNYCVFCPTPADAEVAHKRVSQALADQGLEVAQGKSGIRSEPNPEDLFLIAG
ncbi:MAG: reverse transcriptase domain-containing protein [Actinomycetota bacterium]|nr:reverse transcriptase domain-containing protein [Actinomycetota bacterium]